MPHACRVVHIVVLSMLVPFVPPNVPIVPPMPRHWDGRVSCYYYSADHCPSCCCCCCYCLSQERKIDVIVPHNRHRIPAQFLPKKLDYKPRMPLPKRQTRLLQSNLSKEPKYYYCDDCYYHRCLLVAVAQILHPPFDDAASTSSCCCFSYSSSVEEEKKKKKKRKMFPRQQ